MTGAPMSWAMIDANTMASVSRRIRPWSHTNGSMSASSPAALACSSTWPRSSSAAAVIGSSRSIRVMCFTPDQPSAAARGTLATRRSSSSNAEPARPVRLMER